MSNVNIYFRYLHVIYYYLSQDFTSHWIIFRVIELIVSDMNFFENGIFKIIINVSQNSIFLQKNQRINST